MNVKIIESNKYQEEDTNFVFAEGMVNGIPYDITYIIGRHGSHTAQITIGDKDAYYTIDDQYSEIPYSHENLVEAINDKYLTQFTISEESYTPVN